MSNLFREIATGWAKARSQGPNSQKEFLIEARLRAGIDDLDVFELLMEHDDFGLTLSEKLLFQEFIAACRVNPMSDNS